MTTLRQYSTFVKENVVYRASELYKKILLFDKSFIPSRNSMFHVLDNMTSSVARDYIDVDSYKFMKEPAIRKMIYHVADFKAVDISYLTFPKRLFPSGLRQNLITENNKHKTYIRPISRLTEQVIANDKAYVVMNYNPLFRLMVVGDKALYHRSRFKFILHNCLLKANEHQKFHYICIPLSKNLMFPVSHLFNLAQKDRVSNSQLISSDYSYFFLLELISFVLQEGDSIFSKVTDLESVNLIVHCYNRAMIFNLGILKQLVTSRDIAKKMILTIMSITHRDQTNALDKIKDITEPVVSDPLEDEEVKEVKASKIKAKDIDEEPIEPDEPITLSDEAVYSVKSETKDIDTKTEEFIETIEELTPAQKARAKSLASSYKTISITKGGKKMTIEELMKEEPPSEVSVEEITSLEDTVPDKSMLKHRISSIDETYRKQFFKRDIISNLLAFQDKGLFLTDYEEEDVLTSFDRVRHIKASFVDPTGKKHVAKIKLPLPDEDGYFLVNGVKLTMKRQLVNIPICKVSPIRVSLISNYNKTIVEKMTAFSYDSSTTIKKFIDKSDDYSMVAHSYQFIDEDVPYDYVLVGSSILEITSPRAKFFFLPKDRSARFKKDLAEFEKEHGVAFGKVHHKNHFFFISKDNSVTLVDVQRKVVLGENLSIYEAIFNGDLQVPYEWCNLKILDKNIPIIFILAYRFGLTNTLKYLNVKYRTVPKGKRLDLKPTEIPLRFKYETLIIDRYPLLQSMIVSGLKYFKDIDQFELFEMDTEDPYYHLIESRGMSKNYLIGISNYFSFFVDPITEEVLREMGEPTNSRDLLIRAVDLLITDITKPPSSISNFRIRSLEKFSSVIYNEISRQYANYQSSRHKTKSFSINTEAIYQRIIQDQSMGLKEEINPIHSMKEKYAVAYTGFGGRTSDSFVERDRKFPKDGIGVLSEATPDSSTVGMVAILTGDPNIKSIRGFVDQKDLDSANVISDTALLMPGATNDDPKRANFINVQLSHQVPSANNDISRVLTGHEQTIPYKTSSDFVVTAKENGKILDVNDKLKMVKIEYKDEVVVYQYGKRTGEVAGSFIEHNLVLADNIAKGKKVKKEDVIIYHEGFFKMNPITKKLSWCHGIPAKVAIIEKDITREDSCMVSSSFADKLKFNSIYTELAVVSTDMIVSEYVKVGDKVNYGDTLCKFNFADMSTIFKDEEEDSVFDELKYAFFKSKVKGTITDIQVFYSTEELSDSLHKFVTDITKTNKRKSSFSKKTSNGNKFNLQQKVPVDTKIRGVNVGENDLLVVYYISTETGASVGDKVVLDSSLKSVIADVVDDPVMTESGKEIDVVFGGKSIFNRIILSPTRSGIIDHILEQAEKNIVKMFFD